MPATHDLGYKHLFSHPELVRELITGFTSFDWLDGIDAGAFERVNPAYVSDRFSERQDDLVWRVKLGEQWLYIYILIEFQSGVDRWMALRMQVYIGLLYQDLVKRHELSPGQQLPPVLPLVFYNGRAPWTAATSMDDMIFAPPEGLAEFQPAQRYYLIDQYRLDLSRAVSRTDLLGLLFRLELSDTPDVLLDVLQLLAAWMRASDQTALRHSVTRWVKRLLGSVLEDKTEPNETSLEEVSQMSDEHLINWHERFAEHFRQEGRAEGIQQGISEGRRIALASMLKRMIDKTDGSQVNAIAARIDQASAEEIDQWIERALNGDRPTAIFGEQPGGQTASRLM